MRIKDLCANPEAATEPARLRRSIRSLLVQVSGRAGKPAGHGQSRTEQRRAGQGKAAGAHAARRRAPYIPVAHLEVKVMYTDKVMDHFMNPRNVGDIENPDGVGRWATPGAATSCAWPSPSRTA